MGEGIKWVRVFNGEVSMDEGTQWVRVFNG